MNPATESSLGYSTYHPHTNTKCLLVLQNIADIQDALDGCQATLMLLADLFVAPVKYAEILNSNTARLGMFNQLFGLAGTLAAIDDALGTLNTTPTND